MRAPSYLLFAMLVLSIAAPGAVAEHGDTFSVRYVAGVGMGMSCNGQTGSHLPSGDPEDYSSPIAWLFSNNLQCLPFDTIPPDDQGIGIGGMGFGVWDNRPYTETPYNHVGELVTVSAHDDSGLPAGMSVNIEIADGGSESIYIESCGPIAFIAQPGQNQPWQGADFMHQFGWVSMLVHLVDPVSFETCHATTGVVTLTFTP